MCQTQPVRTLLHVLKHQTVAPFNLGSRFPFKNFCDYVPRLGRTWPVFSLGQCNVKWRLVYGSDYDHRSVSVLPAAVTVFHTSTIQALTLTLTLSVVLNLVCSQIGDRNHFACLPM